MICATRFGYRHCLQNSPFQIGPGNHTPSLTFAGFEYTGKIEYFLIENYLWTYFALLSFICYNLLYSPSLFFSIYMCMSHHVCLTSYVCVCVCVILCHDTMLSADNRYCPYILWYTMYIFDSSPKNVFSFKKVSFKRHPLRRYVFLALGSFLG